MAKFIDEREDVPTEEGEEFASLEETPEEPEVEPEEDTSTEAEEIPDKYQGKDLKDIVRMHQEAEKLLGKQSSEVGELRKIVDDFVQTQLATQEKAQASTAPSEEIDFFDDPKKAVEYAIENHPKIKQAETYTAQLKQQEALSRLKTEHPDYEQVVQDSSFIEWVTKSKFRTDLLKRADQQFDYDAADELLTSWKERQAIVTEAQESEKKQRKNTVKQASTGNTRGSAESPSRKIYRRADIIKLMQTDPDRYMQLAPEIRQAYDEGRVK